jgi:nicotinate-nucleotide pyrophosphorylase (carboxylating)
VTEEVRLYEDAARVTGRVDGVGQGDGGTGLGGGTLAALRTAGLDPRDVARAVRAALDEDFAYGPDVTSGATVRGRTVTADVVAREAGVLAGVPVALAVLDLIGGYADRADASRRPQAIAGGTRDGAGAGSRPGSGTALLTEGERVAAGDAMRRVSGTALVAEGERIGAGDAVLRVSGPAPAVLGAERTMLNFLTHLSGIATATRAWADAIEGTGAVVRDTRKTTPGLRVLEKYAVRCGGGRNHRMGLGDAALIKDNHVAAAGGVTAAVLAVQAAVARSGPADSGPADSGSAGSRPAGLGPAAGLVVEVECDSLAQVREALRAGAHFLLLDNMPLDSLREAVAMASGYYGVRLEASGGLRLSNARAVAETGVDYLAVGALTHSSPALDLGLDFSAEG